MSHCHLHPLPSLQLQTLHYALRSDIFEGVVFHGQHVSKIFAFINAKIFAFTTIVKNTSYMENLLLKSEKNILHTSHLIFCTQQVTKYLIYGYFYFLILLYFSNILNVIAPIALKPCALASLSCTKRKEAHDRLKTGKVSTEGKGRRNNVDILVNFHQITFSYRYHTYISTQSKDDYNTDYPWPWANTDKSRSWRAITREEVSLIL